MHLRAGLSLLTGLLGCAGAQRSDGGLRVEQLGPDLQLIRVTDTVWVHISDDQSARWGTIPANGLIVVAGEGSVLVDTGWKVSQTERLLAFAETELGAPIRRVVLTHGHADRAGGVAALAGAGAVVHAQALTAKMLARLDLPLEVVAFDEVLRLSAAEERLEVFHPGAGHTRDNSVVWLENARILFAGCLVKSARSADLGNREDAVLAAWPSSVLSVLSRYGAAELVVPGHGPPGRIELLQHTLGLLEQELASTTLQ